MSSGSPFVVCVKKDDCLASLETRKIYVALADRSSERHQLLRVIDESGEDYLYPKSYFRRIELTPRLKKAVLAAA